MTETTSILVLVFGTLLFTLFAVFTILYVAIQKKRQYQYRIEKQDMEHRFTKQLMQSRLEVQEKTLKHLSEELHDNIAQVMGLARMKLIAARKPHAENKDEILESSVELLGRAINEVRTMSHTMNSGMINKQGLEESIRKDIGHICTSNRISCKVTTEGAAYTLGTDKELIIFRIVQECLANAVKHGQPAAIYVHIKYQPEQLYLTIEDTGRGYNPEAKQKGMGLMNIEERIKLLNGKIDINSGKDRGTIVNITIPK